MHWQFSDDIYIFVQENEGEQMIYIHKDHLCSFQSITNEEGEVVERYAFDPWGRRRNADDWSFSNFPEDYLFDRGYTGHEHLDDFGLINMNGRVYDPYVARFLSPDPFVQNMSTTQSFNRYSYVSNNPLKFVDPSGYQHGNHPMTAPITVNYQAYNILGSGYQGGLGPQNGNHWSNEYNSLGEVGDFLFMSPKGFNKMYGEGATQIGRHLYSDERSSKLWRDGEISVAEILEDGGMYWDPISGEEVGRESYFSGNISYTNIYYTGDWVHLPSFIKQDQNGGGLSWSQAKAHYQFGGGTPVNVDLSSIDLSRVSLSDFNSRGLATIRLDTKHFSNTNDALAHGTITLQLTGANTAKIALNSGRDFPQLKGQPAGMYNFEMQSWESAVNWIRNPATFLGGLINGTFIIPGPTGPIPTYTGGTPFPIYYHGTATIP